MKVALIHDYIKEYGGAERVLEALHEIWPEAPVFTTVYLPKFLGPHRERFKDWDIRVSWVQKLPLAQKLISPIRILTPWIFDNLDFSGFDLVIASATGAYFPNLIVRKPYTLHICYCHTPPRYLYGYPTARNWQKHAAAKAAGTVVNHWLRQVDFISYQRPDYIVANSHEVKRRVEKFYRREATVIYPPVEIKSKVKSQKSKVQVKSERYFLAGGRLARAKRIDLAIEACNRLKLPLKVFGRGFADWEKDLKQIAGPTVEFLGEVDDNRLLRLYQGAKALIYPSEQEDFGILPVEAMACGVPVIALNQGGVKETVINGKTGILVDEATVENLTRAIKELNKLAIKSQDCIKQAKKFSKERFKKEIKNFIEEKSKKQITFNI
ncbi:glycosyltransferase family 4 protein [Candidatus Gottesmanbacteria bacterium]|nr:glycosyltransferase family 4 protein [Candidatus Gottesmanbacteria bacterium]